MKKIIAITFILSVVVAPVILTRAQHTLPQIPNSPNAIVEQLPMYVGYGGRTVAIAIQPDNANHTIVASETGGLFRTFNNGATWSHLDNLPVFVMNDVQYLPAPNSNIVIATSWPDGKLPNDTGGIWRSEDGGSTWSKPAFSNPTCAARVNTGSITISGGFIFVATDCGYSVGTNSGTTWTHFSMDNRVWAWASDNYGAFYYCDQAGIGRGYGSTYISGHISTEHTCNWQPFNLAAAPQNFDVIYNVDTTHRAPCNSDQNAATLFEGVYNGISDTIVWTQASDVKCRGKGWGRSAFVATNLSRDDNPNHYDIYFSDGYATFRKTCDIIASQHCGGTSGWDPIAHHHDDHNDIGFDPITRCAKYLATDGGVQSPIDFDIPSRCGAEWNMAAVPVNGYNALQVYDIAATNMDDHVDIYAGTQDNAFWGSQDGGATWTDRCGVEGYHITTPLTGTIHTSQDTPTTYLDASPGRNYYLRPHLACPATEWPEPMGNNRTDLWHLYGSPYLVKDKVYIQFTKPITGTYQLDVKNWAGGSWNSVVQSSFAIGPRGQVSLAGNNVTLYEPYQTGAGTLPAGEFNLGLMRFTGARADGTVGTTTGVTRANGTSPNTLGALAYYPPGDGAWTWPTVFAVDPYNPNNLLAADMLGQTMKTSIDGGLNWIEQPDLTNLVTNFGEYAFRVLAIERRYFSRNYHKTIGAASQPHAIAYNPFLRNHIVVGTNNLGIIQSMDGGRTWESLDNTEQITNITDFAFAKRTPEGNNIAFYTSSYGRGVWKITVPIDPHPYMLSATALSDWQNSLVDPHSGVAVDPGWVNDPTFCPYCEFQTVPYDQVMDITTNQDYFIESLAIDNRHLIGSDMLGEPVQTSIPTGLQEYYGDFIGCEVCRPLIYKGYTIRGIVSNGGILAYILLSYGDLPNADRVYQFDSAPDEENLGESAGIIKNPYIRLESGYPFEGYTVVNSDSDLTVLGSGFSWNTIDCTKVNFYLDGDLIGESDTDDWGSFEAKVKISKPSGHYWFEASQTCPITTKLDQAVSPDELVLSDGRWVKVVIQEGWWDIGVLYLPIIIR